VAATWTFGLIRTVQCATRLPLWVARGPALLEGLVTVAATYCLLRSLAEPDEAAGVGVDTGLHPFAARPRYVRSSLTPELRARVQRKLAEALATAEVTGDSMLSLRSLSRHLNEKAHYVSQVINQDLGTNFYELVNRARVERAQRLLGESPDRTVLEVALAVGYNSKSTFNAAFRRHTGLTPTAFRQELGRAAGLD